MVKEGGEQAWVRGWVQVCASVYNPGVEAEEHCLPTHGGGSWCAVRKSERVPGCERRHRPHPWTTYTHTRTTVIVDETVEWKFILRPRAFVVSPFCIAATLKGFRFVAAEYT